LQVWLATPEAAAPFDPASLDAAEREEWARLRTGRRRLDWAASRSLLHAASIGAHGARSLSHSHAYAALALAPGSTAVGVDVEWLAPREFAGMADVGYSPAEAALIASLAEPGQRCAAFYELWTLKEACAKALGLSLVDSLRQCRFVNDELAWEADIPIAKSWQAIVYAPRPDLRLSLVWVADTLEPTLSPVAMTEWPSNHAVEWPTVRCFSGPGRSHAEP
jgi:phosphopantetheinyl transferase (holo-ACP synthase)